VWRRKPEPVPDDLAAECAAFLVGRYASYLAGRCRPVPVWAWTNVLAHATEADLHDLMRMPDRFVPASGRWALACAYVAGEVLDLAERHGPLPELQASVLVPLELELATRPDVKRWSPRPWVTAITTSLGDYRRARERQTRARSRPASPRRSGS
jgi:hypothetical protein